MKNNIFLAVYKDADEKAVEEIISDFETDFDNVDQEAEYYNVDLDFASDEFLLQMSRLFERHIDKMYMLSCISWNDFGSTLSDKEKLKVCNALYNTWLKDESNMSVCSLSDAILRLIEKGDLSVDEALEKSGRELLMMI